MATFDDEFQNAVIESITEDMQASSETDEADYGAPKDKSSIELAENQRYYTDLFGDSFTTREHPVTVLDTSSFTEELKMMVPELDKNYHFPPEATEKLVMAFESGDKTLMTGPTGCGKSSLVKNVCAMLNRPFIRVNMSGDMESSIFFGQLVVEDGATAWRDGVLTEGFIKGAVVLIDEWDTTPAEIMMGLQWVLEDDSKLFLKEKPGKAKEKMLHPHPDFRIVCGGNTLGQGDVTGAHAGTAVQNTATLDRFQTVIKMDYIGEQKEVSMLVDNVEGLKKITAKRMVKLANLMRSSYKEGSVSLTMSPRTLINWGRKTVYWGDDLLALKMSYFDKIEDSEKDYVNKMVHKVYHSKVS
jgi:cobaltochelatase CobS